MASIEGAPEPGNPSAETSAANASPEGAVGVVGQLAQLLATEDAPPAVEPGDGETQRDDGESTGEPPSSNTSFSIKPPSGAVLPPTASRKRARSEEREAAKNLPPIPKLSGDNALEAFTHRSLSRPGHAIDGARLGVLGLSALEATMTVLLCRQRLPMLSDEELKAQRQELLTLEKVEGWTTAYGLMDKLRCAPAAYDSLQTPNERYRVFLAVVGAVYVDQGMQTLQKWLGKLVFGDDYVEDDEPQETAPVAPPQKRQRTNNGRGRPARPSGKQANTLAHSGPSQGSTPVQTLLGQSQFIPAAAMPPMFNAAGSPPMILPPASASAPGPQPNANGKTFLLAFHEHAVKRGVRVEYETEGQMGPNQNAAHWIMICKANGIPKGRGFGKTKQIAKEFAARQAFATLGWV